MSDRFVVQSVTGPVIAAHAPQNGSSSRAVVISYYVLDRAYCYEVVGDFTASGWGYGHTNEHRRCRAEELCQHLNAWDQEWGLV